MAGGGVTEDVPPWRRVAGVALTAGGVLAIAFGLYFAGMYVWGVVDVLDQPDRSWLFWGLAILFLGIGLTFLGAVLVVLGRGLMRSYRGSAGEAGSEAPPRRPDAVSEGRGEGTP